ncbi:DUF2778 domain-containing protein (plasmid) [Ralstonia syzygii]|uniref:DUF2778 domain-containing protein n=1 Tax=Ralstonia syzygii TaxID=28097 RepID=A0ABX7ZM48_9RALS|nr:DUF2778 domain-containing protein [Ralstonia syzygii]QUP56059.1 DUF2778 domain-containing protein [Ralstonia syzygii]
MPVSCTYALNNSPLSTFVCLGMGSFTAFSGMPKDRNNPTATDHPDSGPLPAGKYYIVDRESGGNLGWLYDSFRTHAYGTDRDTWLALYREDDLINDQTFVKGVKRGAFRLHPIGPARRSAGCITFTDPKQYDQLRAHLVKNGATMPVPGTTLKAYGTVEVK